jgi:hypothetical protein
MSADGPVRRSLENFLTAQSLKIPVATKCPKCGSAMSHTLTTFSFGAGKSWRIQLPVCLCCSSDYQLAC